VDRSDPNGRSRAAEFEQQARRAGRSSAGPISEFLFLLRRTRKWWMAPILLALLTMGAVILSSGTAVAPLIYALF
jgi:hypothetical protein